MNALNEKFDAAKLEYDQGGSPLQSVCDIAQHCLSILGKASSHEQGRIASKQYLVFQANGNLSRPYRPEMLHTSQRPFRQEWDRLVGCLDPKRHRIDLEEQSINTALYTAVMALAICYDLWKPKSRKTPGTYFEIVLGSVIAQLLPDFNRSKFITIPGHADSVSTDIVFSKSDDRGGLVIPAKITTRERIVQPFAHQRILNSVFGDGAYKSVLVCVSELQRDANRGVNEICVPGTIRLFQSHLASLSGIYYLDPPLRYLQQDLAKHVVVGSVGKLLAQDFPGLL
jgi:hypothetical protein